MTALTKYQKDAIARILGNGAKYVAKKAATHAYGWAKRNVGRAVFPKKKIPFARKSNLHTLLRLRGGGVQTRSQKKKRVYHTKGTYSGKFKNVRSKTANRKWYAQGSVERIERGGVISDSQCAYVGATNSPMAKVLEGLCRCILKELLKQAGVAVTDWTNNLQLITDTAYRLDHTFYVDANSSVTNTNTIQTNITSSLSLSSVISDMVTNIQTHYGQSTPSYPLNWILYSKSTNTTVNHPIVGTVVADQFSFEVKNYVMMLIQNRTLANGTEANQHDNITNNPLIGKMYVCKSNGAVPRVRGSAPAPGGFIPDQVTGIFNRPHGVDAANLIKPPKAWYFRNVEMSSNVRLEPGAIKRHSVSFEKRYTLSNFLVKMNTAMTSTTKQVFMGSTVFFALEKLLDSRDSESVISIGYEVNTTLKTSYSYKKQVLTNPVTLVDLTPIPEEN